MTNETIYLIVHDEYDTESGMFQVPDKDAFTSMEDAEKYCADENKLIRDKNCWHYVEKIYLHRKDIK